MVMMRVTSEWDVMVQSCHPLYEKEFPPFGRVFLEKVTQSVQYVQMYVSSDG